MTKEDQLNLYKLSKFYDFKKEYDSNLKSFGVKIIEINGDRIVFSIDTDKKFYRNLNDISSIIEDYMPLFLAHLLFWCHMNFDFRWTYGDEEEVNGFQFVDLIIW